MKRNFSQCWITVLEVNFLDFFQRKRDYQKLSTFIFSQNLFLCDSNHLSIVVSPFKKHNLSRVYFSIVSLKPENVLIGTDGYIKLTDFGLSKNNIVGDYDTFSVCGTPEYLAPEVINKKGHGRAVDWWCLGSIMYELIHGLPPFYSKNRN